MIAHQDRLRAFIYSLMPNSSHVADVLQNTNTVLWQKRDKFDPDTNFTAWAMRIARYQTMHQLDRDKRDRRLVFSDELIDMIAAPGTEGETPNPLLQTLEKHAESLGRTAGSLRIALHRIREALRKCIESNMDEETA